MVDIRTQVARARAFKAERDRERSRISSRRTSSGPLGTIQLTQKDEQGRIISQRTQPLQVVTTVKSGKHKGKKVVNLPAVPKRLIDPRVAEPAVEGVIKTQEDVIVKLDTRTGKEKTERYITIGDVRRSVDPRSISAFSVPKGSFKIEEFAKIDQKDRRTIPQRVINTLDSLNKRVDDNVFVRKANITLNDLDKLSRKQNLKIGVRVIPGVETLRFTGVKTGEIAGRVSLGVVKGLVKFIGSAGIVATSGLAALGAGSISELNKFYNNPRKYATGVSRTVRVVGGNIFAARTLTNIEAGKFFALPNSRKRELIRKGVVITGAAAGTAGLYVSKKALETLTTKKGNEAIGDFIGSSFGFSKLLQGLGKLYRANKIFQARSLERKFLKQAYRNKSRALTVRQVNALEKLANRLPGKTVKVRVQELKGVKVGIAGTKTEAVGVRKAILGKPKFIDLKDLKKLPNKYVLVGRADASVQNIAPGLKGVTVPALRNVQKSSKTVTAIVNAKQIDQIAKYNLKQTINRIGTILDNRMGAVAFRGKFVPLTTDIVKSSKFTITKNAGKFNNVMKSFYSKLHPKIKARLNWIKADGSRIVKLPQPVKVGSKTIKQFKVPVYRDFKTGKQLLLKEDKEKLSRLLKRLAKAKKQKGPLVQTGEIQVTDTILGKKVVFSAKKQTKEQVKKKIKTLRDIIGKTDDAGKATQSQAQAQALKLRQKQKVVIKQSQKLKQELSRANKFKDRASKASRQKLKQKIQVLQQKQKVYRSKLNKALRTVSKFKYKADLRGAVAALLAKLLKVGVTQKTLLESKQKLNLVQKVITKQKQEIAEDIGQVQDSAQKLDQAIKQALLATNDVIRSGQKSPKVTVAKKVTEKPKKKLRVRLKDVTFDSKPPKGKNLLIEGYVAIRGKRVKIVAGLPPNRAFRQAFITGSKKYRGVDNSTPRSFEFRVVGFTTAKDITRPKEWSKVRKKLSKNKKVLALVEKTKFAIDSRGEKKGLKISKAKKKVSRRKK